MALPEGKGLPSLQAPSLDEGLRYYIVRPDNTMVPLVPADQLPFQLQGIPNVLNHQKLSKEKWTWVADTAVPKTQLSVRAPAQSIPSQQPATPSRFAAPDHAVRAGRNEVTTVSYQQSQHSPMAGLPMSMPTPGIPVDPEPQLRPRALTDAIAKAYPKDAQRVGYSPRTLPPSGIEPDPSRKEYCSHWIRTGECAFTVQGCKYKHEMPTIEKLREMGFQKTPQWWKQKTALNLSDSAPTWMQRRMQEQKEGRLDPPTPSPKNTVIRQLFRSLDRDPEPPNHTSTSTRAQEDVGEPTGEREIQRKLSDDLTDLIDLSIPAPPPSRRSSSCSDSTVSTSYSDVTPSSASGVSSANSEEEAAMPTKQVPSSDAPLRTPIEKPSSAQRPTGKEKRRAAGRSVLSQTSDDESTAKPHSKRLSRLPTLPKAPPPKSGSKGGLASSRHAAKGDGGSSGPSKPRKSSSTDQKSLPANTVAKTPRIAPEKKPHEKRFEKRLARIAEDRKK